MSETFCFCGLILPYLCQREGEHIGERRIEVPIAREWLKQQQESSVIEVGAVLPYWQQVHHEVVDPYDPNLQGTRYEDAENCDFTGRSVLSISTIEHVGRGEYGDFRDAFKAGRVLSKIVREARSYLITLPMGYHPGLDRQVETSGLTMRFQRQVSAENLWEMCEPDWEAQYNAPLPYANVVVFISNSFAWAEGAAK